LYSNINCFLRRFPLGLVPKCLKELASVPSDMFLV
jgi:hypothetical protein